MSPPLSGRPFIEAGEAVLAEAVGPGVAAPERAALHRGVSSSSTTAIRIMSVAASERAALHRGRPSVMMSPPLSSWSPPLSGRPFIEARSTSPRWRTRRGSPPLSRRPFIEASAARHPAGSPPGSPPLSGRPFIEASAARHPAGSPPGSPPLSGRPFIEARLRTGRSRSGSRTSPPLSGRPFIETVQRYPPRRAGHQSPPLSGRPFIEACAATAPTSRCPRQTGILTVPLLVLVAAPACSTACSKDAVDGQHNLGRGETPRRREQRGCWTT